ncbi:glucose 1-dehydrogenase [Tropicimonas marinistellae]|uniref:glucose 1-dehydrogenase n=1 Tax=Tropicimonas marinistellae TaxID=1739787 RepID=UPI00082F50BC|nr:glucose 1-dehydrogenase [Tropicimonas marinistellae]
MSTKLFDLSGKTALITGSSRGLGRAMAEGMAAAGARVILNGVNEARLQEAVEEMTAGGYDVIGAAFDVADEAAIVAAFEKLDSDGVAVDILVNNAGIQFRKPIVELETSDWQRVIDVNLTAVFICAREAAKRMIPRGHGKIINIGSLLSDAARATVSPYGAAKGGVRMLTKIMTAEWASKGIQVNAIGPGYMATEMNTALIENEEFNDWVCKRTPSGRWGQPDEMAGTAIYLASDASNYINGQLIYVDGGMISVL